MTSFFVVSVSSTIILDYLFGKKEAAIKYQGSFIKTSHVKNQKTNLPLSLYFNNEAVLCYSEQVS